MSDMISKDETQEKIEQFMIFPQIHKMPYRKNPYLSTQSRQKNNNMFFVKN